jgi:hypothetical protein
MGTGSSQVGKLPTSVLSIKQEKQYDRSRWGTLISNFKPEI